MTAPDATLTPDELADLEQQHAPMNVITRLCRVDGQVLPCDAHRLIAALRAVTADEERATEANLRLRAALESLMPDDPNMGGVCGWCWEQRWPVMTHAKGCRWVAARYALAGEPEKDDDISEAEVRRRWPHVVAAIEDEMARLVTPDVVSLNEAHAAGMEEATAALRPLLDKMALYLIEATAGQPFRPAGAGGVIEAYRRLPDSGTPDRRFAMRALGEEP